MNQKLKMLGVWSAAAFFVVWLIGFALLAGWVPPLSPTMSADEIASLFRSRQTPILFGMIFMSMGATLYLPWTMVLSTFIKDIEGDSYFLSGTQLVAGVMSAITFFLPAYEWATAAFRPERDPEITQALVDKGWLLFITPIGPFLMQYAILAVAIFMDRRPVPAFPRWAAFLQIWVCVSFLPGLAAFIMKTGPFAWNGLFVWWIPLTTFTAWFAVMIALARKAVLRDATGNRNADIL